MKVPNEATTAFEGNLPMNTDPALKPYIARVREIADRHDNGDSYAIELAAANLAARRPAYWSGSLGYSNSTAGILVEAVNRKASVLDACAELKVCYPYRTWIETPNLDYLLPLNEAALHDLQSAYQACGTFRGMTELARRTERAEGLSPALDAGGLARVAATTEVLQVVAVDDGSAWLKDDAGNRITHRVEDLETVL